MHILGDINIDKKSPLAKRWLVFLAIEAIERVSKTVGLCSGSWDFRGEGGGFLVVEEGESLGHSLNSIEINDLVIKN